MERLDFCYPGGKSLMGRSHVGVVGSGNLEVLMEPSPDERVRISVTTRFDGNRAVWDALLSRFFEEHPVGALVEINDFGATPGVVSLRLAQALSAATEEPK